MDLARRNERLLEVELQQILESTVYLDLTLGTKALQKDYVLCPSGSYNTTSSLAELCNSGNVFVDKVVFAFASLATEADLLTEMARNKIYPALLLYGEEVDPDATNESTVIKFMARFLPFLNEVNLFVNRCFEVCRNTLLQIYGLFCLGNHNMEKASERQMWRGWRTLGDVLVILITLDEIVSSHHVLVDHYKTYQRSIELVQFNSTKFGVSPTDGRLKALFNLISELDVKLLQGTTFLNCVQQHYSNEILLNKQFLQRLKSIITDSLVRWDRVAQEDIPDKHRLMVLCALTVLYYTTNQSKNVDNKLLKLLCATQKRIMAFHLIGDILFTPLIFLQQKLPSKISQSMMDKKLSSPQYLIDAFSSLLDQQAEQLTKEVQFASETISEWKAEMRSLIGEQNTDTEMSSGSHANHLIMLRCNTILKGARLADKMSRLVKCILSCHLFDDRPISKFNAQNIFRLIEMIKAIVATINFYWPSIQEWVSHASLFLSSRIVRIFEAIRSEFNAKASNAYLVDVISALKLASTNLAQSPTKTRLFVCGFALEVAHYTKNFRLSEVIETDELISRLDSILNIAFLFKRVADCSFLYWHRSLSTVYFESLFEDFSINSAKIMRFFEALDDACVCIREVQHIESDVLLNAFRTEIFDTFKECTLDRLCSEVENDLRLTVHGRQNASISAMEGILLRTKQAPIRFVQQNSTLVVRLIEFLQMPSFTLAGHSLQISRYVEDRMNKTFYELTAVALHDSESYSQMRILAAERYNLHLMKNNLPFMGVDQGLDLLRIVTNMSAFVSNFSHDFNEQMFIEKNSRSKMLNVIRIPNAVGSIKTHGFGILNSTVNFAYRALARKFRVFSRFLFDEHIKGQLTKDIRYYRDSIDDLKQMYPLKRAERFNNAIAKLGVSSNGQTYLSGFRELITQIGNIIGFVRLVRSAAAESSAFMAECENTLPNDLLKSSDDPATKTTSNISSGLKEATMGEDYVEMLVGVFTKEFRNTDKFSHLRNFFIIVPPLCINHVEHMIASRLRLGKHAQQEEDFTFVDDGFSLGVAYILTLLNQVYFFSSLNWFTSVDISLKASQESVLEEQKIAYRNKDESYAQSISVRLKRLQDFQDEFQYLSHTLHSAIMIFKTKDHPTTSQEESFLEDF